MNASEWLKAICNPKVKVGTEWVTKGQTVDQVNYSLGALTKVKFEHDLKLYSKISHRVFLGVFSTGFFL